MNRTIVCKECDNNRVIFEKIGQQLYIKCSKCGITLMQTVHLESWNNNVANTYKLKVCVEDDRLFEADIIKKEGSNIEFRTLEQTKIRLMYLKQYEFIRQLGEDEYREIRNLNTIEN